MFTHETIPGAFVILCCLHCSHCCHPGKGDRELHRKKPPESNSSHQFLRLVHQGILLTKRVSRAGENSTKTANPNQKNRKVAGLKNLPLKAGIQSTEAIFHATVMCNVAPQNP